MWKDELAAVRVSFKSSKISSCSLVLSYNSHMGVEQRMEFMMVSNASGSCGRVPRKSHEFQDRSRGFLLDGLAFDHAYTLRLWHIGAVTTAYTSHEFRTTQCLKLVNDPALCGRSSFSGVPRFLDMVSQLLGCARICFAASSACKEPLLFFHTWAKLLLNNFFKIFTQRCYR